ncbi:MAG: 50S ribosomal protein L11 methyltransferase [Raineya sp.]|jgi:ribosomal protein L11 methyltransferase|nr:50S ribosomal protein L11 methyltransferase [Raineya sp.]
MFTELIIETPEENFELLIAELADLGFESFVENENILQAYIASDIFDNQAVKELQNQYEFTYTHQNLQKVNWNEEWEKNYQPVEIGNDVRIRAVFHDPDPNFTYEILITPKMSFGTGHHETTSLMVEHQLGISHQNKRVLDAGCGTGVLAIMAHFLGATNIEAFDNDDWAVENTKENIDLNHCNHINAYLGTIETVDTSKRFDILLANINRNVLLNDIPSYAHLLVKDGYLLLSGFYESDIDDILAVAQSSGLELMSKKSKNNWVSLVCKKLN